MKLLEFSVKGRLAYIRKLHSSLLSLLPSLTKYYFGREEIRKGKEVNFQYLNVFAFIASFLANT